MGAVPKLFGCVVHRTLPGHVKVKTLSVILKDREMMFLSSSLITVKPDPGQYIFRGRFVQYGGKVYYISKNCRVYESNIDLGEIVKFLSGIGYRVLNDFQAVPVTLQKLDKVEWLFL